MSHLLTLTICVAGFIAGGLAANATMDATALPSPAGIERIGSADQDGLRGGFDPFVTAVR